MYNEIIENEIRVIGYKENALELNTKLSQALTEAGYPDIICLGIHQPEGVFEGVIMDGLDMSTGPIERFEYNFQTDTFTTIEL
jgi:hypothetical protein